MSKLALFVILAVLCQYALSITDEVSGNFATPSSFNVSDNLTVSISYDNFLNYNDSMFPPRLLVEVPENSPDVLIVFVRHKGGSMSWQLPYTTKNEIKIFKIAHTLWTPIHNTDSNINTSKIIVNFSTNSKIPIKFTTVLSLVQDFIVPLQTKQHFNVILSQPVIRYFKFEKDESMVLITVLVHPRDNPTKEPCMTLSIQNSSNRVVDTFNEQSYQGLSQTVIKQGGIIASKKEYPVGFILVFNVHSSNKLCYPIIPYSRNYLYEFQPDSIKNITLNIIPTINFNTQIMSWVLILISLGWILIFCALFYNKKSYALENNKTKFTKEVRSNASSSTIVIDENDIEDYHSDNETDKVVNSEQEKNKDEPSNKFNRIKKLYFVSDLSMISQKLLNVKSKLYLWNLITIAIFYSLPVVQLVFFLQKEVNQYGNQDKCYYNFLCSHSLIIGNMKFTDFNHIFSNIGYVFFGLLFIILTYKRECSYVHKENFGIPRHSGLYYSMGTALALEGLMSACYHVCPNPMNFQFDTSFMYIICLLCMVKIYQSRHPDINGSAYFIFGVLAFVIMIGFSGILAHDDLIFNVFFSLIHLTVCLWLSTYIYYMGSWSLEKNILKQFYKHLKSSPNPWVPKFKNRIVQLGFGFFINLGLSISHIVKPELYSDFPSYLLALFLMNSILYLFFYLAMKYISQEHIYFRSFMYILIAMASWCAALFYYNKRTSSWNMSPAQSRELNTVCVLFQLFDYHDIWHFLSAASMFFSFMVLLTMDDDLAKRPTSTISVF